MTDNNQETSSTGAVPFERLISTVTVCDKCLQASCWQGEFMCDKAHTAGTMEKTIEELTILKLEHPSHWKQVLAAQ